ncbi:Hypothetical Protein FCC1311_014612 [Hondaea fermentalgiana]|uniref:Uncharacterized protein n=1 Tax=Hondaea fermentalgiana TaxID=2315210 RepID=A0A2R5GBX1_9STRA|nr:Hypothetical Protein FCC1311_014612 [Hondaea fermentalgiana]|eukprot:GBG25244.1 Hypothetical Protein FCC1311_014612 [Hondaea fermentalgiana]
MAVNIGELMWTSVKAILPVFLILGAGAWGVRKGIFDERSSATLSWLSKWVYAPSLVFVRLGQGLSQQLFREVWVLGVMGVIIIVLNFLLALVLVLVGKPTKEFRKWYIFALTFPNITALPLVFISAVCSEGNIRKPSYFTSSTNPDSVYFTSDECVEQGQLYLFIYIIFPDIMMYATASVLTAVERANEKSAPASAADVTRKLEEQPAETDDFARVPVMETRRQSEIENGETNELALPPAARAPTPAQAQGSQAPFEPSTSVAQETLPRHCSKDERACTSPAAGATATANNLEDPDADAPRTLRQKCKWPIILLKSVAQPPVLAMILAIIVGVIPSLQAWIFSENTPATPFVAVLEYFAPGLVSVVTLALALLIGNKMTKTRYSELLGGDEEAMGISRRTLFVFVFGRTIFIPGVTFALLYAAIDVFPQDQLLLIILFFEAFVPTANMCAICAPPKQGQIISLGQINQYIVGMISMTMWCFAGLTISTAATDPAI